MTLKNFSYNPRLLRNRLGQGSWVMLLYGILFFFNYPVNLLVRLSQPIDELIPATIAPAEIGVKRALLLQEKIHSLFYANGSFISVLPFVMALLSAAYLFHYLTNKQKTDFYHSQPLKRSQLFSINMGAGILYYLIPLLINLLITFFIILFSHNLYLFSFPLMAQSILHSLTAYVITFCLSSLVAMLTGTTIAHLLGSVVALVLCPAIFGFPMLLLELMHETYYSMFPWQTVISYLSPLFALDFGKGAALFSTVHLIYYLALSAVALVATYIIYLHRPNEAAGKTIAFPKFQLVLKYLLTLVLSAYGGLFFVNIAYGSFWLVFGAICVGLLSFMVLQAIFDQNIKSAFRHLGWGGATVGVLALILCIPAFDLLHFDTYLPNREKVVAANVYFEQYDRQVLPYLSRDEKLSLHYTDEKIIDKIYEIAQSGVESLSEEIHDDYCPVLISLQEKNGWTTTRYYQFPSSQLCLETYEEIFQSPVYQQYYQEYAYPQLDKDEEEYLRVFDLYSYDIIATTRIDDTRNRAGLLLLTWQQAEELIQAYAMDVDNRTFHQLKTCPAIGFLEVGSDKSGWTSNAVSDPMLYTCDENTLALLEEYGITFPKTKREDVQKIYVLWNEQIILEITSPTEINSLLSVSTPQELYYQNKFLSVEEDLTMVLEMDEQNPSFSFDRYYFIEGKIPDFLYQQIPWDTLESTAIS